MIADININHVDKNKCGFGTFIISWRRIVEAGQIETRCDMLKMFWKNLQKRALTQFNTLSAIFMMKFDDYIPYGNNC